MSLPKLLKRCARMTMRAHDDAWCEVLQQLSPAVLLLQ